MTGEGFFRRTTVYVTAAIVLLAAAAALVVVTRLRVKQAQEEARMEWSIVWTQDMDIDHGDGQPQGTETKVTVVRPDGIWFERVDTQYPMPATPPAEWGGGPAPHPISTSMLNQWSQSKPTPQQIAAIEAALAELGDVSGTYRWSEQVDDEGYYCETMHVIAGDKRIWFKFEQGPDQAVPPEIVGKLYQIVTGTALPSLAATEAPTAGEGPLVVSLELADAVVVQDASLRATVTLTNTSGRNLSLPNPWHEALIYEFKHTDTGATVTLSQAAYDAALQGFGDPPPPPSPPPAPPFGAGQTVRYEKDLASLALTPFAAGTYEVTARMWFDEEGRFSAPVTLAIKPPAIGRMAMCFTRGMARFMTLLTHKTDSGQEQLYLRISSAATAEAGVGHTLRTSDSTLDGLAIAVPAFSVAHSHVLAFVDKEGFHGAFALGSADGFEFREMGPAIKLELDSPQLLPWGYRIGKEDSLFFVTGTENGKSVIVTVNPWPPDAPGVHRFALGRGVFDTILTRVEHRYDDPQIHAQVVWTERPASGTDVYVRRIAPFKEDAGEAPRQLLHSEPAVLAVALEPRCEAVEGVVDVLTGTLNDPSTLTLHRLPLTDKGEARTWAIPALNEGTSSQWALLAEPIDDPPVAAVVGNSIMIFQPSKGAWSVLAETQTDVSRLSLHAPGGYPWAVWVTPANGITYRPLEERPTYP